MLGALFYPKGSQDHPIPFDSLYIPYIYKEIYFEGVYIDIFNQKKDLIVLDVGANIGVVTQYMREYAKKLYAIEPSPEHFEALKQNKEYNNWDNVDVFNVALADKDGEMKLSQNEGNRTMNTLMLSEKTTDGKYLVDDGKYTMSVSAPYSESVTVQTVAFNTFFEQNGIETVDFVKFDVEGAEDLILRSEGFKKVAEKIKAIEVEFHYPTWSNLVEYMISLGFKARRYESSAVIVLFTR